MGPRQVPTLRGPGGEQRPGTRSVRGPQLPRLVPPHHPRAVGLRLPGQHLRASDSPATCPGAHRADPLRSAASAGPPPLARSHFSAAHLSVVVVAQNPSILGRLLPSSPPRDRRLSLFLARPGFSFPKRAARSCQEQSWESCWEFSWHVSRPFSRTNLLGKLPGLCQRGSRSGCPFHTKGVALCPSSLWPRLLAAWALRSKRCTAGWPMLSFPCTAIPRWPQKRGEQRAGSPATAVTCPRSQPGAGAFCCAPGAPRDAVRLAGPNRRVAAAGG